MADKTAHLNMRIDPKLKAAAEQLAKDDRRSLASLVEYLLQQHLTERGFWPPKPKGKSK
jgi:hypothetical protein